MAARRSLDSVRRRIDDIDDAIHDLLVKRAKVVEGIAGLKDGDAGALRPGREATILRRLVGAHRGVFPKPVLVRIWREIFAANVGLQGPFSVAVHAADGDAGYWDLARDQYGSHTPMTRHQSSPRVIDTVARGEAVVGVLPVPTPDDVDPWWPHLMSTDASVPRIIARLPFAGPSSRHGGGLDALAIGCLAPEATDADRTFIAIDTAADVALGRLTAALVDAGLDVAFTTRRGNAETPAAWLHLAEVDGFVDADDRRLMRFAETSEGLVGDTVVLGSYAVPLSLSDLAPAPPRARKKRP